MADVMTPAQRSRCMSMIRGTNTKPELSLRQALWKTGLRYRLGRRLTGRPDLVFVGPKVAVFVDGCFWHGCPEHAVKPKNNAEFWKTKLARNRERDAEVNAALKKEGWTILRFWEHEVKNDLDAVVSRIRNAVNTSKTSGNH